MHQNTTTNKTHTVSTIQTMHLNLIWRHMWL